MFERLTLFNSGAEKLDREVDIADIIDSLRKIKVMFRLLLSENQQFLAQFASSKVLKDGNSSEEDDPTHIRVPRPNAWKSSKC